MCYILFSLHLLNFRNLVLPQVFFSLNKFQICLFLFNTRESKKLKKKKSDLKWLKSFKVSFVQLGIFSSYLSIYYDLCPYL